MTEKTTIEQIKSKMKEEILSYNNRDWIKMILLLSVTALLMAFAVLYLLDMFYVINIASDPCGVCMQFNPDVEIVKNIKMDVSTLDLSNFTFGQ